MNQKEQYGMFAVYLLGEEDLSLLNLTNNFLWLTTGKVYGMVIAILKATRRYCSNLAPCAIHPLFVGALFLSF